MNSKALTGFSLIELLVALAITGILAAFAIPAYQDSVAKSKRANAQTVLEGFSSSMERYKSSGLLSYLAAGSGGANTGTPAATTYPSQAPIDGTAEYNLTINAATATTYTLRATPVSTGSQSSDGYLEVTSSGIKRWDQNNNGSIDSGENTW